MTTAVVGGTGFLGRAVRAALRDRGRPVVAIGRRGGEPGTVALDLASGGSGPLARLLLARRVTAVVNAAGSVWTEDPVALDRSNVEVVRTIRDAVARVPWPVRVVQLGSLFEYAYPPVGEFLTEASPCRPASAYGRSKLRGSEVVLHATRAGELDGVVLRVTSCAGPGTPPDGLLGRVARELRSAAEQGRPARLHLAPLTADRDYVDSRDVAAAVLAAIDAAAPGPVVNIGRGEAIAVRRLVGLLIEASGVPATVHEREPAAGRSAQLPWLATRIHTARLRLGWQPRHDPEAMVRSIWTAVDPRADAARQAEEVT